jgi:hypothetical protein
VYSHDFDIVTQVLYGEDLPQEWKRLVIVKEALHVFDPEDNRINTPDGVRRLIPAVISPELRRTQAFAPAVDDFLGAYKAMAVLLPRAARVKLAAAANEEEGGPPAVRTSSEIAQYAALPDFYVDLWLSVAETAEKELCDYYG